MNAAAQPDFLQQIEDLLAQHLPLVPRDRLSPDAHLSYDLNLDSVDLMQLLVLLETEAGYVSPDYALNPDTLQTLGDLERIMTTHTDESVGEPDLDVKVHCVVSCLCHPIKQAKLDHRPLYFGVWDAEVFLDEASKLRYHSEEVDHDFFVSWFERLYDATVTEWYDKALSKSHNIASLESLMCQRSQWEHLLVMIDMYRLPERQNRFELDPFPHYVLLENGKQPDKIWMWDPDFRWEGELDRRRVLHAIESPAVAGGYLLDTEHLHEPSADAVAAYFSVCFKPDNLLTQTVERVIKAHHPLTGSQPLALLGQALAELPVLAIRKYAYEHGLAYFYRATGRSMDEFENWCLVIEALAKGYEKILYLANKWAITQKESEHSALVNLITEQHRREDRIKAAMQAAVDDWHTLLKQPLSPSSQPQEVLS
jgi:acyl carrier protein